MKTPRKRIAALVLVCFYTLLVIGLAVGWSHLKVALGKYIGGESSYSLPPAGSNPALSPRQLPE